VPPYPFFIVCPHPGFPHPVLNALKQLLGIRQRAFKLLRGGLSISQAFINLITSYKN
jgi:hypothetical protein